MNDTEDPVSWTKESLAAGLAEILGKDASAIRKRMDNVKSQYEVIQLRADEDTAAKVRSYVDENKIAGVHLVADTKRYYPYGSLAAQVIGFVGLREHGAVWAGGLLREGAGGAERTGHLLQGSGGERYAVYL